MGLIYCKYINKAAYLKFMTNFVILGKVGAAIIIYDFQESFCHGTGKPSYGKTSMRNPILYNN